jgi:dihydroneopterin aldolase
MSDRIILKGMTFYGYHGVASEEQTLGQRFVVDVEVRKDLRAAGATDDLRKTLDYSLLFRLTKEVVEGPSRKLLESVAQAIAERVLSGFDVESVTVRVMKPEVPIKGSILEYAAVEIVRERDGE